MGLSLRTDVFVLGGGVEIGVVGLLSVKTNRTHDILVVVRYTATLIPSNTNAVNDANNNRTVQILRIAIAAQDGSGDVRTIFIWQRNTGKTGAFASFVHAFNDDFIREDAFTIDISADFAAVFVLDYEVKMGYVIHIKYAKQLQSISKIDFGGSLLGVTGSADVQIFEIYFYYPP